MIFENYDPLLCPQKKMDTHENEIIPRGIGLSHCKLTILSHINAYLWEGLGDHRFDYHACEWLIVRY